MGQLAYLRRQHTENLLRAMSRVFDDKKDWFNFKTALVTNEDSHFVEDLKKVEAWGFLKNYKDTMHPSLLTELLEVQETLVMLKLMLMSAVVKEYARFP